MFQSSGGIDRFSCKGMIMASIIVESTGRSLWNASEPEFETKMREGSASRAIGKIH
jgi:hypothetical protein